jgi:UDP-3-O-acyl-N-acetylglucosamine deacetylase
MCEHEELFYNEFPTQTIGGGAGDYSLTCPVTSARWVEYCVMNLAGNGNAVVSGDGKPAPLPYDGSVSLNDQQYIVGTAYSQNYQRNTAVATKWERVTNSQKRVFVRIDPLSGTSLYVSIKFRARLLDKVPAQVVAVHPDHAQQLNIARAEAVKERLKIVETETEGGAIGTVPQDKKKGLYYGK